MNQRPLLVILTGFVFIASPVILQRIPVDFTYPLTAKLVLMGCGILLIAGGVILPRAERYKLLMDFFIILSVALFAAGPLTFFPLGREFWFTITLAVTIFIGLPAVLLLHLSSKNA